MNMLCALCLIISTASFGTGDSVEDALRSSLEGADIDFKCTVTVEKVVLSIPSQSEGGSYLTTLLDVTDPQSEHGIERIAECQDAINWAAAGILGGRTADCGEVPIQVLFETFEYSRRIGGAFAQQPINSGSSYPAFASSSHNLVQYTTRPLQLYYVCRTTITPARRRQLHRPILTRT